MRLMTLLLVLFATTVAMASDFKAATVDFQRVFNAYPGTAKAQKKLSDLIKMKQDDLTDSQKIVIGLQKELKGSASTLSPADKKKKAREIKTKEKKLQDEKNLMQNELTVKKQEMTRELIAQVRDIIADTAEKDGIDLVLEASNTIYIKNSKDLTGEILSSFQK